MIGSETFIMVAFRCTENSTPWRLASAICASTKPASALRLITAASMISPAFSAILSLSTLRVPSLPVHSMRTEVGCSTTTDFSLP